jgi:hypothetical protein
MSAIKLDADKDNNHAHAHENSSLRKETDEHVSNSLTFRAMVLFQVVAYGSYSILVHLCERDGTIMFSSTTMNLVLELIKLAFSFTALFCTEKQPPAILIGKLSSIRHSLF